MTAWRTLDPSACARSSSVAGAQHYFADSSLPSYDADAAALLMKRTLEFLRG
jgi:dienelactone hydrolase